jgi:hypothetical protein
MKAVRRCVGEAEKGWQARYRAAGEGRREHRWSTFSEKFFVGSRNFLVNPHFSSSC